nr:hypothetical protein [Tanacetum cinerariifolium]
FDRKMVVKPSHDIVKVNNSIANKDSQPLADFIGDMDKVQANVEDGSVDEHVLEAEIQKTTNKVLHGEKPIDSDPFGLVALINQKCRKVFEPKRFETPKFPPGYAPIPKDEHHVSEPFQKQYDDDSHNKLTFI